MSLGGREEREEALTSRQRIELVRGNIDRGLRLREQWDDRLAGVATNDGDDGLGGILGAGERLHEGLGAHDVERGDAEELLRVEFAGLLEDLGGDGHGAVDGVGDDQDEGVGCEVGDALHEARHNARVDLEQIVAGHAWLACRKTTSVRSATGPRQCRHLCRGIEGDVNSRGMPAGMTTISAPVSAFLRPSSAGKKPSMEAMEEMWDRSAVTPGVLTTS